MPGAITHTAVALLARDRIRQIRDSLRAKEKNGRVVNDIERRIRYLAEKAFTIMTTATPTIEPPVALYGVPPADLGSDQVSKFLLMGAIGPDIPEYAALYTANQKWLRDTLHKGTPDINREQVLVGSCNYALAFWRKVQPHIDSDFGRSSTADQLRHANARACMQAYVLGHFSHVATDLVSAPFIDNLEFQLGTPMRAKLSRDQIVGALEVEVSRAIFRRGGDTRGSEWVNWWPAENQVPGAFYKASKEALEEIYGPGAVRPGLLDFENTLRMDRPPELSEKLLRDGYGSFRTIVDVGTAWDYWDWLTATWFMYLPSLLAYPLALALPNGKDRFRGVKPPGYDDDKALFEILALPFAVNSLVPLYYSIIANTSYLGAEREVIAGWVSTGVQLAAAIGFILTIDTSAEGLPWRYIFLFGLPLLAYGFHIFYTLWRGVQNPRRKQLLFASIVPVVLSFLFIGLYFAFMHTGVEKLLDPEAIREPGEFVWRLVVWFVILFALWWLTAVLIRWFLSPSVPAAEANALVGTQGHHIRLFDDASLFLKPPAENAPPVSPTLADLFYPSGRRALMKLWWDGNGAASIIAHRDRLEFNLDGHVVVIPAPPAGMKTSEFAEYLERNVLDFSEDGGLKAEPFHTVSDESLFPILELEDHELPPGLAFSDDGDGETTQAAHDAKAGRRVALRASTEDPYVLYHAPKAHQSVRFDAHGPSLDADETTAAINGTGMVNNPAGSRRVTLVPAANNTRFTQLFRPGDLIEVPQGSGTVRVVVSVDSDEQLTISTPFPAAPMGATFARAAQDRRNSFIAPIAWSVQHVAGSTGFELQGTAGFDFGSRLKPGDMIIVRAPLPANPLMLTVREVPSDTVIIVSDSVIGQPMSTFQRVAEQPDRLIRYLAGTDDTLQSGGSIMNHAADLAALLCLGATSQLLSAGELPRNNIGSRSDLTRVHQVFRNWNLDRRRENEWKMLILGGAVSEKRGDVAAADVAVPPADPRSDPVPAGEPIANSMGWVNVLRNWVEMARSPLANTQDRIAFRPGNPTNLELSQALAYLLDIPDPGAP